MKTELTDSDFEALYYFYVEKGDVERWVGWEETKPLLYKLHPELMIAFEIQRQANIVVLDHLKRLAGYETYS